MAKKWIQSAHLKKGALTKKAEAAGVKEIFVDDLREEFVRYVSLWSRPAERW